MASKTRKTKKKVDNPWRAINTLQLRLQGLEDRVRDPNGIVNTHGIAHQAGKLAWQKMMDIFGARIERVELMLETHSNILHHRLEDVEKFLASSSLNYKRSGSAPPVIPPGWFQGRVRSVNEMTGRPGNLSFDIETTLPSREDTEKQAFIRRKLVELSNLRPKMHESSGDLGRWARNRKRLNLDVNALETACQILDMISNLTWEVTNPAEAMKKEK